MDSLNSNIWKDIRGKLKNFLVVRPQREELIQRGYLKNEPVFGSTLKILAETDQSLVPAFLIKCVNKIESKTEFLKTEGIYRIPGNLSTIQRIRFEVDHGNYSLLETTNDPYILCGALKTFFRELQEPLVSWIIIEKLIPAVKMTDDEAKKKSVKEIVKTLPPTHYETLIYLIKHLKKVSSYHEDNKMADVNLAVVFGPSLTWPPFELTSHNFASNLVQQNLVIEMIISYFTFSDVSY